MRVAVFSARRYDRISLDAANHAGSHELVYFEPHLDGRTVALVEGFSAVCAFVNDTLDEGVLTQLAERGVRTIALRCAGFNKRRALHLNCNTLILSKFMTLVCFGKTNRSL